MRFTKNPSAKYRSVPFWSLNGDLREDELRAQIRLLKEMGFGGVFIHSRTGLVTEYMGDEWLRLVRACVDECEKAGVDAWLYDEDRWPSGTCGGYVTQNEAYRSSYLCAYIGDDAEDAYASGDPVLGEFAVRLCGEPFAEHSEGMPRFAGMSLADYKPTVRGEALPQGYMRMVFTREKMLPDEFYNDATYVDTMNEKATEDFLARTHEKYAAVLGDAFARTVKGIFTDEPHRGTLLNGFGITNPHAAYMLPYTGKLFAAYRARFGENLAEKLPELYFFRAGESFSRTMWRYVEVLQRLFLDGFAKPVYKWCRRHKLKLTGHVLHEDTLSAQTTMSGSVMRFYEHMTYPGLDNLGTDNVCFPAAIAVSSVARQTGKNFVLSELYGASGWKTTFAEYKNIGDWQAAKGVTLRCPHLSWYTMGGEAKRDYPASIGKQAPWHGEYRAVEDYFARLGKALKEAKPVGDVLVVTPVESAWGLSRLGVYYNAFAVRDTRYAKLEEDFASLTESLVYDGIEFDYGDEEMMGRLSRIGRDERGAFITVGKAVYRTLVLPAMVHIRTSTLALARKFAAVGGRVIVGDAFPAYADGQKDDTHIAGAAVLPIADIARALHDTRIGFTESGNGKFFGTLKKADDGYLLFAVNASRTQGADGVLHVKGTWQTEQFDLRTGKTVPVACAHENGETTVARSFAPGEEVLVHFTSAQTGQCRATRGKGVSATVDACVPYRLSSPNVLVLDRAQYAVNGVTAGEDELLKIDRKLRAELGLRFRGGNMVQPWYTRKFGGQASGKTCDLTLSFAFDADVVPQDARLQAEDLCDTVWTLNGHTVATDNATACEEDVCYKSVPLDPAYFVKGRNELTARRTFGSDVNLENIFITGTFGVAAGRPCRLTSLPNTLALRDVTAQGLPFYAGSITYMLPCADGEYIAKAPTLYAACLKNEAGDIAIAPPYALPVCSRGGYAPVTAVLTPKNMFGPLHELPACAPVCGPEDYHTAGAAWSDDYALLPQGILGAVTLEK